MILGHKKQEQANQALESRGPVQGADAFKLVHILVIDQLKEYRTPFTILDSWMARVTLVWLDPGLVQLTLNVTSNLQPGEF